MKAFLLIALSAATCGAAIGPHPVTRTLIKEDAVSVFYKDKMSDGTYRDSAVLKPRRPEYAVRTTLVATNDAPRVWELVYESVYEGGRRATNRMTVLKDKRDVIRGQLTLPPMPDASTNAPGRTDALGLAKQRFRQERGETDGKNKDGSLMRKWLAGKHATETNAAVRMGVPVPRVASSRIAGGKVVHTLTDGTERAEPLRRAHTARVNAAAPGIAPPPGKRTKDYLLGFAAGAAAALAAYGIKRVV